MIMIHPVFDELAKCRLCAERFDATQTQHQPRPVFQGHSTARILIVGQAPGARVHKSGLPFTDPSGDRLREWMNVTAAEFYDPARIAILPMAFCFPGFNEKGADLPPPPICARTWRTRVMTAFPNIRLTLVIGQYAQKWHLPRFRNVTDTVRGWKAHGSDVFPLPHPSWRNTAWLKKNPWFEIDLLPELRRRIQEDLR
jgi:uracil-DNA glycosylase